jgi:hypothetical protein
MVFLPLWQAIAGLSHSRQRKVRTPKGGMPRENEGTWV